MAELTKSVTQGSAHLYNWALTQADATGEAGSNAGAADRTVQVFGTFATASVTMQGSNEAIPVNWQTLHDMGGLDLIFTVAGMRTISENPLHIRPLLTGGDGTTAITVNLLSRSRP